MRWFVLMTWILVTALLFHFGELRSVRLRRHLFRAPARRVRLVHSRIVPAYVVELRLARRKPISPPPPPTPDIEGDGLWISHIAAEDDELAHEGGGMIDKSALWKREDYEGSEEELDLLPLLTSFRT